MSGAAWAPAVLCAALGLLLGSLPTRAGWGAALAFVAAWIATTGAVAAAPSFAAWTCAHAAQSSAACWIAALATAGAQYAPERGRARAAGWRALAAGICVAAAASPCAAASSPWSPAGIALALPARWLVSRGAGVALKVAASWLLAVALLSLVLSARPALPGDVPDHLE
ncbi:hypothetical protein [Lysobacter enzymogenes]|uniref:hypothetical protein n=1 Tax=Lysobacter enzymogenes TaxID=69 RepID=UPI001A965530|nr:hypothetical protein [Lysobacter enzymogenes]QQP97104.1 hypothetical protein JHW38_03350 [Lysobacter enzymogenes]